MICELLNCGVCEERKAFAIITSSLMSVTYPTCKKCYNHSAEPRWIFDYLIEHLCDVKHDYITMFYTCSGGKYVSWEEYKEKESNSKAT